MTLVHYDHCPVCNSSDLADVFRVKDYSVSNEVFMIVECKSCSLRLTQDVPDQDSIGSYYKSEDYISHSDTSKGLINNLYQRVRKRTLKQKRKLIENTTGLKNGYLLDTGSGTGAFANEMVKNGWQVTGLEPDVSARSKARELYGIELQGLEVFYELPVSSFDAITFWHVLEHVHELNPYMETLKKLLKPKGKLFIAVPNYTSRDAATYGEYWAAYDVPRHLYHFSPTAMKMLVEKHGMKIEKYLPMWYDSFYVSMLSSKYKKGKTNMPAAITQGLRSNMHATGKPERCSSVIYIISV
jgi:SAM-dependent methyltransferase